MSEERESQRAQKRKFEEQDAVNAASYSEKNVKNKTEKEREIQTVTNKLKTKKIQLKTYKNGVVKSSLVSVTSK